MDNTELQQTLASYVAETNPILDRLAEANSQFDDVVENAYLQFDEKISKKTLKKYFKDVFKAKTEDSKKEAQELLFLMGDQSLEETGNDLDFS